MNLTQNCKISITEPVFSGSHRRPKFVGERTIVGKIVRDSYGAQSGQHTFTVLVESASGVDAPESGKTIRRKGRTLYKNATVLAYPDDHDTLAQEKSSRAAVAQDAKYRTWVDSAISGSRSATIRLHDIPAQWWEQNPEALATCSDFELIDKRADA